MNRPIASVALIFFAASIIPAAQQVRYKDTIFDSVSVAPNIQYGSAINAAGSREALLLDLYAPKSDTAAARPLIVMVHGGSFMAGTKQDADVKFMCVEFARRGYVTASINYRLNPGLFVTPTKKAFTEAVVRAVQDAKAGVRFLRSHKTEYRIDDSRIVVGGTSAGAVTAVQYAYCDPAEIAPIVDTMSIGGIEGNSGTPGVSSAINVIVNCWGAVGDTSWIVGETMPIINFHGTADNIVPYDAGFAFGNPALPLYGSAAIHRVAVRNEITSVLRSFAGMGHGVSSMVDPRADTILFMTADFLYTQLFPSQSVVPRLSKAGPQPHDRASMVFLPVLLARQWPSASRPKSCFALNGRSVPKPFAGLFSQPIIGRGCLTSETPK